MDDTTRQHGITLYDRFTHEGTDRRAFMAEMVRIAGSVAAAEMLIAGIAAAPAAAAQVPENDPHIFTRTQTLAGGYKAYVAEPRTRSLKATVLVIHENRGLNDHIRDVARRVAVAGYRAVAPDMLSPSGGTPANEDAARDAIGKLDLGKSVDDAVAFVDELARSSRGGKVGAVGFCWGGGFVNRLAVAAGGKLAAAIPYYGPAPDPAEAPKVEAAMEFHNAGLDERVNATSFPWIAALRNAGKTVKFFLYDGVNHAFNNDTSAERYNKPAADLAWKRTLAFFRQHLG
ncbi:dienelactone hydrolase family protein [Sphingomonas sp. URHD0057]|uniref:dienelactone hydrolase family protein n=1 Tax=Sphingomonas sp. URHD0057 TaxID=1380389 RepID=UPI00048FFE8E|nr:dienelactone hydrolase family protein [Sphingomonas sp. URHD0057]